MKIKWNVVKTEADLPKPNRQVLITYRNRGRRYIDIGVATPKFMRLGEGPWWDSMWDGRILAWAELPEPYAGKTE